MTLELEYLRKIMRNQKILARAILWLVHKEYSSNPAKNPAKETAEMYEGLDRLAKESLVHTTGRKNWGIRKEDRKKHP